MITHNGDHKRIAPTILDIHMSIVSEQWTNYSYPMFIDFQTSCLSLYSKLSIYRLFIHAVRDPVIKRERVGTLLVCSTPPHAIACPKPGSGFLKSHVVFFLCSVSSVKMRGHCFALFDIGWFDDHNCFNKTLEIPEGPIKNGQTRETSNIW